ncbi:N-alpha-acetyltransferase 80-like isoform X1 [Biomphalaria glabrata]|uniref:N-alpha-acetyltransferase 80-like isoform X1 n=1 Tax=Biomphalaria glabrata TaxID=6526 RepID=A0A9U8EHU2_BIOGL|nr:N-alpha-acetyltransferase 80-like isoform X1 [Biomphalaria glabrata]XP_013088270.2 N-alpha-acetyltransferase 80-like isoform X1 [Biomphalaria glabrata]
MEVVPLHKHLEYTEKCVQILNTYWPRSTAAREHSLAKSCDHMPISLAFITKPSEVIGYSRISSVQGIKNACLIESVIIDESLRGKGLGRILMKLTEDFAKSRLGIKSVYLSTLDQEGFYSKLGYVPCKPVISLGDNADKVSKEMLQKFARLQLDLELNGTTKIEEQENQLTAQENSHTKHNSVTQPDSSQDSFIPPPPPLPAPKPTAHSYSRAVLRLNPEKVVWMKKDI